MTKLVATVTKAFPGVEDGKIYGRMIEVGEVVHGDLAKAAIDAGVAVAGEKSIGKGETPPEAVKTGPDSLGNGGNLAQIDQKSAQITENPAKPAGDGAENGQKEPVSAQNSTDLVEIPADWKTLKWSALKILAEKVAGRDVKDAGDAKAVIEAELARRAK